MTEPRTEAGRRLMIEVDTDLYWNAADQEWLRHHIRAIETDRAGLDLIRGAFEVLEIYGGHIGNCRGADGPCTCGWREEIAHLRRVREARR